SSYSCFVCCGDSLWYTYLAPYQILPPMSMTSDTDVTGCHSDCYGNPSGCYGEVSSSWWVQNVGVTSLQSVGPAGRASALAAGSSDISGTVHGYNNYQDPNDWELCAYDNVYQNPPGNVETLYPAYLSVVGTPAYTQGPPAPYVYNMNRQILDQHHNALDGV